MPVPTIQTVKERVVFFRIGREKICTLNPLTVWIIAVAISPSKTENRIKKLAPRSPGDIHYTGEDYMKKRVEKCVSI